MPLMKKGCPCCSGKTYSLCCEPLHLKKQPAKTCEALMRSRYSAYALGLVHYLVDTTAQKSRSKDLAASIQESLKSVEWLNLTIKKTQNGQENDKVGKVEFVAQFVESDQTQTLHELSRFCRYQGNWVYLDGKIY